MPPEGMLYDYLQRSQDAANLAASVAEANHALLEALISTAGSLGDLLKQSLEIQ